MFAAWKDVEGATLTAWCLIMMTPLPALSALAIGHPPISLAVVSMVCTMLAFGVGSLSLKAVPWALAAAFLAQTMLFTAAFKGHPWQIDTHMAYFAVLAIIAVMCSIPVLIASAGFIALHHVGMSVLMPEMVYPGDDGGVFGRTVFHAVIVVVETVVLALSIRKKHVAQTAIVAQQAELAAAADASRIARDEADAQREDAERAAATLSRHLDRLSQQDLMCQITEPLSPQYETARRSFNNVVATFGALFKTASATAQQQRKSAAGLTKDADALAAGTGRQSDTLTATASGLSELTQALQVTANDARNANERASDARLSATKNAEDVKNAIDAMRRIETSSSEIANIISMIEDIAFQTNLLALNAGVEAARAGASGRGFAVVASEVRALAQRSSDAAQEVNDLISRSAGEVAEGSRIVDATAESLGEIVTQVAEASTMIEAIAHAIDGQANVSQGLNDSLQVLDRTTQDTAQMGDRMTRMSRQLSQGAEHLGTALSGFRIDDGDRMPLAS